MSNVEFINEIVPEADTPEKVLRLILDNEEFLGYDPYYKDLRAAMLDQARKVLPPEVPPCRGDRATCLCDTHYTAREAAKVAGLSRRERKALERREWLELHGKK